MSDPDRAALPATVDLLVLGAGAGGMTAALTPLPVLGVPIPTTTLGGEDSLYSIVQMPAGVPVGTLAIGEMGATNAGLLAQGRAYGTATLLPGGQVLVIGGDDASRSIDLAEIWDPQDGTFADAGTLLEPRTRHTATLLADGRVLVIGGMDWADNGMPGIAEIWSAAE